MKTQDRTLDQNKPQSAVSVKSQVSGKCGFSLLTKSYVIFFFFFFIYILILQFFIYFFLADCGSQQK